WPNAQVKHNVLSKIINLYADTFKVKQICISYAVDGDVKEVRGLEDFVFRQALDVAVTRNFAFARHGFIDGLYTWDTKFMQKYWREYPMWAEGDWSYTDVKNHGTHGTLDENLDVMLAWHSNFAHFYMDAESYRRAAREDRAFLERGLKSGGLG